ncbi:hypothetical protein F5Y01DRAFT_280462 [Xylaria sp. FL0043]|nr:hypothetical protein F5Y01DRAFT_280462 [Xylaria sp. FL0043]
MSTLQSDMSETEPTRRLSTGGKLPIRYQLSYVVEDAPSHDDQTPCVTAWLQAVNVRIHEGWSASDYMIEDTRPEWSIQIYDTTPQSDDRVYLKVLAEALHRETREGRGAMGCGAPDRFDVWGMPLPTEMSDEERVARCRAHQQAEIASQDAAAVKDFQIPPLRGAHWQRGIVIIDRPPARWDEDEGGFLEVNWDVNPARREYDADDEEPEVSWSRYRRTELDEMLEGLRDGVEWLYRRLEERWAAESDVSETELTA